jgi:glyoxylate reductase
MDKKKVYVTSEIPEEGIELLEKFFEVEVNREDRNLSKDELISRIKNKDGVLCRLADVIDKEVIDNASGVKIFANYAVGFNNIDISEAKSRGVFVTNTPDVLTDTTADLAWALLFAAARRVVESDKFMRSGKFEKWSSKLLLGQDITGKTLGIIGLGKIGKAFGKKSIGFEMNILYYNRSRDEEFEQKYGAEYVDMDALLRKSDFISIHLPLTDETRHFIGKNEFNKMKKTAILVNTARGPIIDEKALVEALKSRRIMAAGLDVYEREPEFEMELKDLDNVVMLPHIGSATAETRTNMALMAAQNIVEVLNGNRPLNPVFK